MYAFAACDERSIRYGLGAVRGVGEAAVEALIGERARQGPFASLEDLCRRLDLQKVNRRVLEALLRSGSLDALGPNRATLMDRLAAAMQLGDQNMRAHEAGQNDLFGLVGDARASAPQPVPRAPLPEWSEAVRLTGERETLGLYLTGHPLARFEAGLSRFVSHRIGDLVSDRPVAGLEAPRFGGGRPVTVAGLIDEVKKRGPRVILTLDDRTGRIEAMLFEETYQKHRDLIARTRWCWSRGCCASMNSATPGGWPRGASPSSTRCASRRRAGSSSSARTARPPPSASAWRRSSRRGAPGPCPITLEYTGAQARGALTLGSEWNVRASRELLEQLEGLLGRNSVQVIYGAPAAAHSPSVVDLR